MQHFVNILDHDAETLGRLLDTCMQLKARLRAGIPDRILINRILMAYFEKPSTRTRLSLETAMATMGGQTICQVQPANQRLGEREALKDIARVVSRYADLISLRTFSHTTVETIAAWATVPVINALSDYSHPTQAMADIMTLQEHLGSVAGRHLVFVGDGNNVARSLAAAAGRFGLRFTLVCPAGFAFREDFCATLAKACPDLAFNTTHDPAAGVKDADVVYTDVWASMGQEDEAAARREVFLPYQINSDLMARAPQGALFMHCLPAHRDEEVTDAVLEAPQSVVFDQAENRMHFYRGLFAELLEPAAA